jgi:hypothetical protein
MKQIQFIPSDYLTKLHVPAPQPAKKYVPDWYKRIPAPDFENPIFQNGEIREVGLKACVPFLDALTTGYVQETWCDLFIGNNEYGITYNYSTQPKLLEHRDKANLSIEGFESLECAWGIPWMPKLPKGWSVIVTHPLNQYHLPFLTLTGIIDADLFHHTPMGNIPTYFKKGFKGLIPAGTPIYQLIPFKRENWESVALDYSEEEVLKREMTIRKKYWNGYRNMFWQKKDYQ